MNVTFCDILIYNRSMEEFADYWSRIDENGSDLDEMWEDSEAAMRGRHWQNSVIGYLHISRSDAKLVATVDFDIRQKKELDCAADICRNVCPFAELSVTDDMDSDWIRTSFTNRLKEDCSRRFREHYIDWTAWENMSKYVDWRKVFRK